MERVSPQFIIEGLMRRGYPAHVAQGFVMNMMDESGLRPGINEAAPIVPGSRGGFGLYQLTGPRRIAYEQFASQRGVNPADPNAQLDFLDYEMRGPESRAAKSILSTSNPQEAAVAIARDFLRPASEHLKNRVARYSGADVAADTMAALGKGGGAVTPDQIAQAAQAQSTGMQGQQQQPRGLLGGFFGNPDNLAALAIALNSMRLNPDPALAALLTGQMKERRSERQTEAQRNRTVEALKKMGADPKLIELAQAGFGSEALKSALAQPKDDRTALQKNYEYAIQMGMTPEQARAWVSSGTTVNVGGQQSQQFGDAPTGTVWAYDEQGRHVMEQGPGGVMRPKVVPLGGTEAEKRAAGIAGQKTQSADAAARAEDSMRLIESIISDPALPQITGMVQGRLPAFTQSGTDLMAKIEQVQGQAFLQAFESLKGGGQITEREGIAAQNAMARLQRTQSTEAMKQSLQELYDIMGRGRRRAMGQNVPEYTGASGGFSVTGRVD